MTIGSFCLIKNESYFIKAHLDKWLPFLDSMVFFDGNSTDGTLEILEKYVENNPKIVLVKNKDPENYKDDYTRLSNKAMHTLKTDLAIFLHPDMLPVNGEELKKTPNDVIAATCNINSFAGEPYGDLFQVQGRGTKWKNIYRLNNPDLGAHYYGAYGAADEDTYFTEITGNEHNHYGQNFHEYSYPVFNSGLIINHYSDVRPYNRRLERMIRCLINQGKTEKEAHDLAPLHPRVSLKNHSGFDFIKQEIANSDGGH